MTVGVRSTRWAFMAGRDIGVEGDPYLDRLRIIQTPLFGVFLHHIHRADNERCGHDHPWAFASVVLAGEYWELVWPDKTNYGTVKTRYHGRGRLHFMGRRAAHKIVTIDKPLWTLVFTGPRMSSWGFYPEGKFVRWQDYDVENEARR